MRLLLLFSCQVVSDSLWPHGLQHARPPCPSRLLSSLNPCPLSLWCQPTISSSVVPFSSCLQSFPASGSFLMSQFFASRGHSIGASASASVLPMNIQDWFPSGWTGWIFLQSRGLSRVFSNTAVQKHQFFSAQPSVMVQMRLRKCKPCSQSHLISNSTLEPLLQIPLSNPLPRLGHIVDGRRLLCPSSPGKAIKLSFLLHPKLCFWDSVWHWCTEPSFQGQNQSKILFQYFVPRAEYHKLFNKIHVGFFKKRIAT